MPQSVEECFLFARMHESVGEEHYQRTFVELFCGEVYGFGDRGLAERSLVGFERLKKVVKQAQEVLLVYAVAAARGLQVDLLAEEGEAKCIALTMEQFNENGSGIDAEGELVWMVYVALAFQGEIHGATLVNQHLATQIGLLLELFDIEAVGTAIEVPIDITGTFAGVILSIVGELDRKTMERTFMPASDESFHYLASEEAKGLVAGDLTLVHLLL